VAGPSKSHFLGRTFDRLIERWLEEDKDNQDNAAPPINIGTIIEGPDNTFTFNGLWDPGARIACSATVVDPDGDPDTESVTVTIPAGAPPAGWDSATAASVVAGAFDDLPHITVTAAGAVVTVTTSSPDYTLQSSSIGIA
jgi:hypothetical protein